MRTSFRRRSTQTKGRTRFALDIGTDMVRAAVVAEGGPRLLGVASRQLPLTAMERGAVANIDVIVAECEAVLTEAGTMAGTEPIRGILGVGSENAHTVQIEARFVRRRANAPISAGEWTRWQARARAQAGNAGTDLPTQRTGLPVALDLLHEAVISVHVDGHRVDDPRRFQGAYVQLVGTYTFAPQIHTGALRTVARRLGLKVDGLVSPAWLMADYAGRQLAAGHEILLLDVGAGITDVALTGPEGPMATVSFPCGGRDFTGAIRSRFGVTYEEAETIKLDYASGLLDAAVENTVADVLDEAFLRWAKQLDEAISAWSMSASALFVGGGGSSLPQFRSTPPLPSLPQPLPLKPLPLHTLAMLHDPQQFLSHENQLTLYFLSAAAGNFSG